VSADQVKVLPFLPASYLPAEIPKHEIDDVKKKHNLPERYLFYPAQFWPHKNHARIYNALANLKEQFNLEIPLVLCGSFAGQLRKETYEELNRIADRRGISNQIIYVGYLPETDMGAVYAGAAALVMPTFHGPTNIPVLEAWVYGCPVITSNVRGIRDQGGDAAVLVDPSSVDEIAEAIHKLWTDSEFSKDMANRGRKRISLYTLKDFQKRLTNIILEAKEIISESRERNLAGR
jgi:glycosyltransferase involved in cell wall biosynthesis